MNIKFNAVILFLMIGVVACQAQSSVIHVYKDNKLETENYFKKGNLIKQISFNSEKNESDTVNFFYKNSLLDHLSKKGAMVSFDEDGYQHYFKDIQANNSYLYSHNIIIPYPFVNANEVSNVANMVSIKNCKEIKNGSKRIVIINGINSSIHFYPSEIGKFIPEGSIVIKYELVLNKNLILEEKYEFDNGKFDRKYFYEKTRLTKILSIRTYNDNTTLKSEKLFKYLVD